MSRYILGNCLTVMQSFPDNCVDMVLTDPPYLVNYRDRTGRTIANDQNPDWLEPAFAEMFRVLRPNSFCVSFYGWTKVDLFFQAWKRAGFRVVGHVVFSKTYASSSRFLQYRHECAYLLAKGSPEVPASAIPDVLPWKYSGNPIHPTQKPVSSLTPLVDAFSRPGDIVLDPFAGSGSSCVAAAERGRRYIGIEMDPKYHAAAQSRLAGLHLPLAA